jgi:hypothetical protein
LEVAEMIKIMLWRNAFGPRAMSHPGHVALAIGGGGKPQHYISYWPDQNARRMTPLHAGRAAFNCFAKDLHAELGANARTLLSTGNATPRPGQVNDSVVNVGGFTVDNPSNVWVKTPDEHIELPTVDDDTSIGLSEQAIIDWWRIFKADLGYTHQYRYISRKINCASIAMAALTVGGAKMYVKPDRQFMYYTPNDVGKYAKQLVKKITKMRADARPVTQQAAQAPASTVVSMQRLDLFSVPEWKKLSAVRIGRRHTQVAAIDKLLGEYWSLGSHWSDTNYHQKCVKLSEMLEQVHSHVATKPTSDRRKAVLALGSRMLAVIKDRADYDQDFHDQLRFTVGRELM